MADPVPGAAALRIVFLTTGLATGGAETMLYRLCSRIDRLRFACTVIALGDKGAVGDRIEALGLPVRALGIRAGMPSPNAWLKLRRLVSVIKPHLVQGWMYHGNLAASTVSGGRPCVWGIRQSLYVLSNEKPLTRMVIRANALLSKRPVAVLYNSRTSARQHEALGFEAARTRIIPNGLDPEEFRPDAQARDSVRRELGIDDETLLLGLIARHHPMKDHTTFLRSAALFARSHPTARFLLAGTNVEPANRELAAASGSLGLDGKIFLLGERADVPRLTAALDIACSTSAWGEGFPNVVAEAMSCGVPCVVTDIGDAAWIVDEIGQVVKPGDAEAIAAGWRALADLGRAGRVALGERTRRSVMARFSLGAVVEQYEDLYERLAVQAGT